MLFNAGVSELWRRTTIYALRALGSLLGMSAREAARCLRLSYVKVVEFQRRGSVHLHALVRVDVRGDELGEAPEGIDADMLATALRIAARKVSAPLPGSADRAPDDLGTTSSTQPWSPMPSRAAAGLRPTSRSTPPRAPTSSGCSTTACGRAYPRDERLPDAPPHAGGDGMGARRPARSSATPTAALGPHLRVPGPLPHQVAALLDDVRGSAGERQRWRIDR